MEQNTTIYLIQASDALQHSAKLKQICEDLKSESRITGYQTLESGDDLSQLTKLVKHGDMVVALLTKELEPRKAQVESTLRKLMDQGIKVAEVIVDHVTYEKEFITFPVDLKPIRAREDMDAAWGEIADQLRDIFPGQETETIDWKKYLKYAALVVVLGLVIWAGQKWLSGAGTAADFDYEIRDFVTLQLLDDSIYYIPNNIQFSGIFDEPDSVKWDFGDSTFADEPNPIKNFTSTGDYNVKFTAFKGGKPYAKSKIIGAFSPPIASFNAPEDGCVVNPRCTINFKNSSTGADNFLWDFGDNTSSEDIEPQKTYDNPGKYVVSLTATNSFGKSNTYSDTITILERPVPLAKFTARPSFSNPRQVTFQNHSQNANQFIWQLGDDQVKVTSDAEGTFVHTYPAEGVYVVRLLAKHGDTDEDEFEHAVHVRRWNFGLSTEIQSINEVQKNTSVLERENTRRLIISGSQMRRPSN